MLMETPAINISGRLLTFETPVVMAIVNVTTDSFAIACRTLTEEEVIQTVEVALAAGATIIDVGGCSTRPGAQAVSEQEEWTRVSMALRAIRSRWPDVIISVDTFRSRIARQAVEQFGVGIINDISGGQADEAMFDTVASLGVAYVLMHTRGDSVEMTSQTDYQDLVSELMDYFARRLDILHQKGVKDVILDPGFGFAKTLEQNYLLLNQMDVFRQLDLPILAGLSRKSMFYRLLETQPTDDRTLWASNAANLYALTKGANILRVHDVQASADIIELYKQGLR